MVEFWAQSSVKPVSRVSSLSSKSGVDCIGISPSVICGDFSVFAVSKDLVLSEESSSSPNEPMMSAAKSEISACRERVFCCEGNLRQTRTNRRLRENLREYTSVDRYNTPKGKPQRIL